MKNISTKQKKYLFKNHAKKVARQDEIIIYIIMPILALISFAVRAKLLPEFLYYDKLNRMSMINLYTHIKVILLACVMGGMLCYIIYRMLMYDIRPRLDYITIGIGIIVTMAIISTLMSPVQENKWWGSYEKANGLLAYLAIYILAYGLSQLCLSKKNIHYIGYVVNFVVIVMCVIGIFQFFGHNIAETKLFEKIVTPKNLNLTFSTTKIPFQGTKYFVAESMLQNPNYFGAFCVIYFPFILNIALKERSIFRKIYYYIGALLTITGITMAQAFASIVTLIGILPLLILVAINRKNIIEFTVFGSIGSFIIYKINKATMGLALSETYSVIKKIINNKYGKVLLITLISVFILVMIVRPLLKKYTSIIIKVTSLVIIITGLIGFTVFLKTIVPKDKYIFSQRGYIWHYTQDVIKVNPLVGVGPDKYYYEFPQEAEDDKYQTNVVIDRPHNMYLQYITDIGFIGLTGFFILAIGICWRIAETLKNKVTKEVSTYLTGILILLLVYLIQGIGNDNMVAIQVMLWPILAFAMSLSNNGTSKLITDKNGTFDE